MISMLPFPAASSEIGINEELLSSADKEQIILELEQLQTWDVDGEGKLKRLSGCGIEALPYHAGLPAEERARNQARFLREDGIRDSPE